MCEASLPHFATTVVPDAAVRLKAFDVILSAGRLASWPSSDFQKAHNIVALSPSKKPFTMRADKVTVDAQVLVSAKTDVGTALSFFCRWASGGPSCSPRHEVV